MSPAASLLYAAVTFDDGGGERYGYAQIPAETPGVTIHDDWDALGMRASGSGSVSFDDVRLPAEALGGGFPVGRAEDYMVRNLVAGALHAAASLGIAEAAHGVAVDGLAARIAAAGAPPPRTQILAAESAIELSAIRAVLQRAGALIDEHHLSGAAWADDGDGPAALFAEVQAAKTFVNEAAVRVVDRALALSGGAGYMAAHPLSRAYRDVRAGAFMHPLGANRAYELIGEVALGSAGPALSRPTRGRAAHERKAPYPRRGRPPPAALDRPAAVPRGRPPLPGRRLSRGRPPATPGPRGPLRGAVPRGARHHGRERRAAGDRRGPDARTGRLHWAVSAYAVAFGGLLLAAGRLADLLGRRRAFLAGLVLFGAASLACGLAPSGELLVAGRAVQGVGAALVSPAALAILSQRSRRARARALGAWASVGALAAASGVLVGGVLVELLDWRWIFLVNVPVAGAALALAPLALPAQRPLAGRRIDPAGALLVASVPALAVLGISESSVAGWGDPAALMALGGAALAAAMEWVRERRSADPLFSRLLRAPAVAAANLAAFLHGAMMLGSFLLLVLYMQGVLGLSPIEAGAGLLAVRATSAVWAPLGARLVAAAGAWTVLRRRHGGDDRRPRAAGADAGGRPLRRRPAARLLVLGLAIPLIFLTVNLLALEGAPDADAGLASGLLNTSQAIGGAVGVAAVAALGAGPGLWTCVALGVAGTAVALAMLRPSRGAPLAAPGAA